MDKNSKSDFFKELQSYTTSGSLPPKIAEILETFFESYSKALSAVGQSIEQYRNLFSIYLKEVSKQCESPYEFEPYHQRKRFPFDYYNFGVDFIRPLADLTKSSVKGIENLKEIGIKLAHRENVIFLANHQTEADPQAISLLLEKEFAQIAEEMIFVAGERVLTDPLAIPFSMGRNLLCIYSKRYIDYPPELKRHKQLHNQRTMQLLSELLSQGGKVIYVAPSGGRDRQNRLGKVEVAPFDAQSVEMFYLMAKHAAQPTSFYPMALSTYNLLPPPEAIQIELGEKRRTCRVAIHLAIGKEIDMQYYPGCNETDKHIRRKCRADYIWGLVCQDYLQLPGVSNENTGSD